MSVVRVGVARHELPRRSRRRRASRPPRCRRRTRRTRRCRRSGPSRQRRGAAGALVDVDRVVGVAGHERLVGVEEDLRPVVRGGVEEGVVGAVAAAGAGREQRRRGAEALVDVERGSVSAATSDSLVSKNTREPSFDAASKKALTAPLPPLGPIEMWSFTLWLALALEQAKAVAERHERNAAPEQPCFPRHLDLPPARPGRRQRSNQLCATKHKRLRSVKAAPTRETAVPAPSAPLGRLAGHR